MICLNGSSACGLIVLKECELVAFEWDMCSYVQILYSTNNVLCLEWLNVKEVCIY